MRKNSVEFLVLAVISAALVSLVGGCASYEAIHVSGTEPEAKLNEAKLPAAVLENRITEIDTSYAEPRTIYRVSHSLGTSKDSVSPGNNYQSLWRGVRACSWLALNHQNSLEKKKYAMEGIYLGRKARQKTSVQAEAYYYSAICLGALLDVLKEPNVERLREMKYCLEVAHELDGTCDYGGPARVLGTLIVETSDYALAGFAIGTLEEGIATLEAACSKAPKFAENWLLLARALADAGEYQRALAAIDKIFACEIPADYSVEHKNWLIQGQNLKANIAIKIDDSVPATAFEPK
jgi:tetratricopeptide (TPR) repeat protein